MLSSDVSVRIIKPAKSAMQSGLKKSKLWRMEFEPVSTKYMESLMNWTGSKNTLQQVTLYFSNQKEAVSYAKKNNIEYTVLAESYSKTKSKSYTDNFLIPKGL